ncbi:MAG: head-tail connector protein [Sphingomonas phyllosphaerae]|uniref:head-tail connector protein n=1 Tax=Sphingomonas phyllosphaerae TaxID=257003 RepID=UPI002FF44E23
MADLVTIDQVREHLDLDEGADVTLLTGLIAAASRTIELQTGRTLADGPTTFGDDKPVAAMAALLLIRTWYDNPEAVSANSAVVELPLAVSWLLWPLKRLTA